MYLFTRDGILSIVAHDSKPGMLMVRAPTRIDLAHFWPNGQIARTAKADYRFRLVLPCEVVAARISEAIAAIDYPKVKPAVAEDRRLAYFDAWSIMMNLQEWNQ
jgi:hypothetical protein